MRARIRAFDWASTPLGPFETWPQALRLALSIAEHSAFPTAIYWGRELRLLYNDAWAPIPGERHPLVLGQPAKRVWSDIWPVVGPQFERVIRTGEGFSVVDQMLPLVRDGVPQETYWNYSFTPLFDGAGAIVGIFNQGLEVTRAVVTERRLSFQIALSDKLRGIADPAEVKQAAAAMLGGQLGAARVGFVEVDEARDALSIAGEWTREPDGPRLAGRAGQLSHLPPAAVAYLRSGQVLTVGDVDEFAGEAGAGDSAIGAELGARAVITVPLVRDGELRAMLYVHEPEPRDWKRSEAAIARDVAERTWAAVERAEAEQRLRDSEDHYRHAVELNPQVSWTSTPDGQLNRVSRRWLEWTGTTGLGNSWTEGLHPDDRRRTLEVWAHCVASGEPYDIEHRVQMVDGSFRWARSRAFPRYDGHGNICLWYGSTEDIHEQKVAEEHQRLLINELNHRVKNTLATVQAIAFQTLKGEIPLDEARRRFEARLMALSRAHNLLTERNWEGAELERVVRDATDYLPPERFAIGGDSLWLAPRAALGLALALHELSTNATKYGALSTDRGSVTIDWTMSDGRLRLEWKEQGGPDVAEPAARGFGSRLIEHGLAADLGGEARLQFESDGLRCVFEASLEAVQAHEIERG
ncbi:MAG TPA: HWE histidine kinase domain-containing protein [Allosphingosinicella sp.]|nr:HWE histidine kinase domain-containing protein [Allosphingosinicella sp.]